MQMLFTFVLEYPHIFQVIVLW